jgi:signal transduction histidine kinase
VNQVLGNLLANAIRFSPDKSTITVFAEERSGEVQFSVRDHGAGIAADVLPNIFDRFWQSESNGRVGLGLGLYIVKGIVEAHGGQIGVHSQLGEGSTFSFSIPDECDSALSGIRSRPELSPPHSDLSLPRLRADSAHEGSGSSS